MQTVKTISLVLLYAALLGACGLRGPLYLPDQDPSKAAANEQNSPLDIDSTDNTQAKKDKKKKDSF